MCRTAQPWQKLPQMEKKGDTAEVPLSEQVQKCTNLAEVAIHTHKKRAWQKLPQVQKCTNLAEVAIQTHKRRTWQKLPQSKDVQKCTI